MSNFDDYITGTDKPFAENINDALLLSNVFDLTVPIQVPTMFRNSTWVDSTSRRKCGVAIVTLKEALPSGVSISTVDGKSVLTGTGTVKLGFYPNFNSFGRFKSITWENTGTVQINLKTVNNTIIANNISKGNIENASAELRTLQEIVIEIVLDNSTLKTLDVVMENKQQTRYGAEVGIDDVTGLDDTLTEQDNRITVLETTDGNIFNYELYASRYNVSFQPSDFRIVCHCTDVNGNDVMGKPVTLKLNGADFSTETTDDNGIAMWDTFTFTETGLHTFSVENVDCQISVRGWKVLLNYGGYHIATDGSTVRFYLSIDTDTSFPTVWTAFGGGAKVPQGYRPFASVVVFNGGGANLLCAIRPDGTVERKTLNNSTFVGFGYFYAEWKI